jgi:hypothetical protein
MLLSKQIENYFDQPGAVASKAQAELWIEGIVKMEKNEIWTAILQERANQDKKWGGPIHDDNHNSHDWIAFIAKHLGRAVEWPWNRENFKTQMIRVAALAVAALEWLGRITQEGDAGNE